MAFKFNAITGKLDYYDPGLSVFGNPVEILYGGTGSTTAEFSPTISLITLHYYVSTTGSDYNDGLTLGSAFRNPEKALNSIPLLMGRVYQINIADGTYNLTAKYTFKTSSSVSGDTDWGGKVIIYGNPTTPGNVVINALSTSTTAFEVEDKAVAVEFNGITVSNCNIGVVANNARVIFKNTNINYQLQALQVGYASQVTVPSGNTGMILTSDGVSAVSTGIVSTVGSSVILQSPVTITGFKGANAGAINVLLSSNVNVITSLTITADAAGARYGILTSQGGQMLVSGGTHSFSNISVASTTSLAAAFAIGATSRIGFQGGATINFTNCLNAYQVAGTLSEVATITKNYISVTNKVISFEGSTVDSTDYLNATGGISYTEAFNTQNIFGYDNRYVRTALGATGGTLGSVAFFDSAGKITQDNTNFFWDDTNNRLGLGGVTSPLYTLDVKGSINSQSTPGVAPYNNITYANFVAQNEYNDYPTGKFLIGQTTSDVNVGLVVGPLFATGATNKTAQIIVSTNASTIEATSYQTYLQQTTTLSNLITLNRSATTGAGAGTPFAISIGTGTSFTEKVRVTINGLQIGATSDLGGFYTYNNNNSIGMIASSVNTYSAANGPFFIARGNTYTTIANQRGNLYFYAGNPSTPGALEGRIAFGTGSDVERMTILSGGNVGIGTSAPTSKFHVAMNDATTTIFTAIGQEGMRFQNTNSTVNNWTELIFSNSGGNSSAAIAVQNLSHVSQSGRMIFATGQSGTLKEAFRIDEVGNAVVGGYLLSPAAVRLYVNGSIATGVYSGSDFSSQVGLHGTNGFNNGSTYVQFTELSGSGTLNVNKGGNIDFYTHLYGATTAIRARLQANGHFLVNTTTDSSFSQMKIVSGTGVEPLALMNSVNSGFAFVHMLDYNAADAAGFGYANPSAVVHADKCYFYTVSKEFFISTDNTTTRHFKVDTSGNVGVQMNTTALGAKINIGAGTATASTAPLKFTLPGVPLTVAVAGVMETDNETLYYTNSSAVRGTVKVNTQISSSAATLTLDKAYTKFIFTGSSATTWTMFALASNTGKDFTIHNRGSAAITLNSSAGANDFSDLGVAISSKTILAGETWHFYNDGTYFIIY